MTKYYKPSTLGAPLPVKGFRSPLRPTGLAASMLVPDPLAPETTVYWDQSTGAQQPGAGGPQVASRIYYDNAISALTADNVQDAIDLMDNQLDNITGASSSIDARVDVLEVEMDEAQGDITELFGRMVTVEGNIVTLQTTDTNLQAQIDAHDVRLTAAETTITVHTADIAALTGRVTTAEGEIDALQAADVALDTRLDAVEASGATNTADIAALQAADVVLDGRLDAVETLNTTQDGRLTAIEGVNTTQDGRLTTLEGKTGQATEATAGIAEIATTAEVTAAADDARIVTPLKLSQRLASFIPSVPQATETVLGGAEVADTAEMNAGASDARMVTPVKLAARLAAFGTAYLPLAGGNMGGNINMDAGYVTFVGGGPIWYEAGQLRVSCGWDAGNDRWFMNMHDAAGALQWSPLLATSNGIGIGGIPDGSSRLHAHHPSYCQIQAQAGASGQGALLLSGGRKYSLNAMPDGDCWLFDNTASTNRLVMGSTGRLTQYGPITCNGQLNGNADAGFSGHVWALAFRGGAGDAGVLRCWGTANSVNFRWGNGLYYRIDEAVDSLIVNSSTGVQDFRFVGGQPGPTGIAGFGTQAGTVYGWWIDAISDPKLKRDMAPTKIDALAVLEQIDIIEYAWKDTGQFVPLGVNAAQVREHIPEMAASFEGGPLRINLRAGVPWLMKAVQQLSARVRELEMRHGN